MDCLKPLTVWYCGQTECKADGVKSPRLVFDYNTAFEYYQRIATGYAHALQLVKANARLLSCGKCNACKLRKRKDMTVRLAHETKCADSACFITLTYDDAHIPMVSAGDWRDSRRDEDNIELLRGDAFGFQTLLPSDVQKFMKRLRRHLEYVPKHSKGIRDHVEKIRYFAVGEYGTRSARPHYHIMIFGWRPSDMVTHQIKGDYIISRSAQIEKLWRYGFSTVCDVNYGVAKYCARYVTKKFARLDDPAINEGIVCPEFVLQSVKGGGIGAPWLDKYANNLRTGYVTVANGEHISKCSIPRYYYDRLRKINLPLWLELRDERLEFLRANPTPYDYDAVKRKVDCAVEVYRYQVTKETL